jgi:RimJ/RimL family protein N-acetyltransferase
MASSLWPDEVELRGRHAVLTPLRTEHAAALSRAAADGELHRLWYTTVPAPAMMVENIQQRLMLREKGSMLPFTVIEATSGGPVGMTTYMNIDAATPRVEIGSTWYAARVQRSGVNTECKRMLLGHAFEALGCVAVELRTHFLNHQSRRAIERLGARLDGVLRNHTLSSEGLKRDTCVYSILDSEWPTIRRHLDHQLERDR